MSCSDWNLKKPNEDCYHWSKTTVLNGKCKTLYSKRCSGEKCGNLSFCEFKNSTCEPVTGIYYNNCSNI